MSNRSTAEGTGRTLATGLLDCVGAAPLQTGFPSPPTVHPAGTGLAGPSEHSHSAPPPFLVRRSLVRVDPGSYPAVTPSGHAPLVPFRPAWPCSIGRPSVGAACPPGLKEPVIQARSDQNAVAEQQHEERQRSPRRYRSAPADRPPARRRHVQQVKLRRQQKQPGPCAASVVPEGREGQPGVPCT